MAVEDALSDALIRKGVAASTIREALGDWIEVESLRIIAALAAAPATLEALVGVQADAKAYHKLRTQLELTMNKYR